MPSERAVLSRDTSREAEAFQVRRWRSLSTTEIARLVTGASQAARTLTLAGLRARYSDAPDHELVPLFALLTLGPTLAREAYPDLDRRLGRPAS
ncbi:MAG: hypothetical protein HYX76_16525 [Acidobacteria bacterium]|nr:hypothetical protein [Acidobacteriota bacterium]